jgi:hypothetical protein
MKTNQEPIFIPKSDPVLDTRFDALTEEQERNLLRAFFGIDENAKKAVMR